MIEYIKTEDGAAAKFPYELKDAFRKAFPSAKWSKVERRWEVGSRSVKRLQQWLAEVEKSGLDAEISARDQQDMSLAEVAELEAALAQASSEIGKLRKAKTSVDEAMNRSVELRAMLDARATEILEARQQLWISQDAAAAVSAQNDARISHIVTRSHVESLRSTMRRNWHPKLHCKGPFNEAQAKLREIMKALAEIGIECRAIKLAADANFNRRDRDFDDLSVAIEFVVA